MKHLLVGIFFLLITKAEAQSSALAMADSLYAAGDYTNAITTYEQQQLDAKILLQLARSHKGLGRNGKALDYYKRSLEQNNRQPIAATEYGRLLLSRTKFQQADSVFGELTNRYPKNAEYYYQWGRALKGMSKKQKIDTSDIEQSVRLKQKRDKMYVDAFAKAVSLDSTHQKAIYQLALYQLTQKDYPLVEKLCTKALETEPENVEIINVLAQNFYYRGFYAEAIEQFEKLIELGQSNEFIHEKLGYSYYQDRFYALAIDQYKILLANNEEDWGIHLILAKLYNYERNLEKAKYHSEMALYFKDLPLDDIYMTRGTMYRSHKMWKETIEAFQAAIKENEQEGSAYYFTAVCADNYYEDKKAVLKLYERFVTKFRNKSKYMGFTRLAEERVQKLKQEIFMRGDGN